MVGGEVHNCICNLYPICTLRTDDVEFVMEWNAQTKISDTLQQIHVLLLIVVDILPVV